MFFPFQNLVPMTGYKPSMPHFTPYGVLPVFGLIIFIQVIARRLDFPTVI